MKTLDQTQITKNDTIESAPKKDKAALIDKAVELNEDVLKWIHGGACCAWKSRLA